MNDLIAPSETERLIRPRRSVAAGLARTALLKLLSKLRTGRITLREEGVTRRFGGAAADFDLQAVITIHSPAAYTAMAFGGSIGAAEAYMAGHWTVDDLTALVRIVLRNQSVMGGMEGGPAAWASPLYKVFHLLRRNTVSGSRRNIVAHYDLGNDFYKLFLDETMTYSSGIFEKPGATLKAASIAKYDRICRKLQLSPDDHVLEIGTGWGGFAEHAATRYGCRVTTTTISDAQYRYARERFAKAGIADRVELLRSDYRELRGRYDKIVSIEMIEAVGHHYLKIFMDRCAGLLHPHGVMGIQAITIADHAYDAHKKSVDFIKRYIFPGSCIPSLTAISRAAAATDLRLFHLEDITPHYAETLRRWRANFVGRLDRVRAMGFSEAFIRMWTYYLNYCEAGFEERYLGDVQLVFTRPLARMPAMPAWYDAPRTGAAP